MSCAKVYTNVEDDDDKDEDDVAHEPHVDLLKVGRLGEIFLDGCEERGQHEERGQGAHESVREQGWTKATRDATKSRKGLGQHSVRILEFLKLSSYFNPIESFNPRQLI